MYLVLKFCPDGGSASLESGSQAVEGAKHHGRYQKGCSTCQNCDVQASVSGLLAVCLRSLPAYVM